MKTITYSVILPVIGFLFFLGSVNPEESRVTTGGEVSLDLSAAKSSFSVSWFDIRNGKMVSENKTDGGKS